MTVFPGKKRTRRNQGLPTKSAGYTIARSFTFKY